MDASPNFQAAINRAQRAEIEVERNLQKIERLSVVLRTTMELCNILRQKSDDDALSARLILITQYILNNLPASPDDSDIPF